MIIHNGVAKLLDLHLMFMLIPEDLADVDVRDTEFLNEVKEEPEEIIIDPENLRKIIEKQENPSNEGPGTISLPLS